MKYFKPKSSTWWMGVALTVYGALLFLNTGEAHVFMEGLAIIGLRAAVAKG